MHPTRPAFAGAFNGATLQGQSRRFQHSTGPRRQRTATLSRARQAPTCVWVERSASVVVEVNPTEAFDYYIDLEAMPKWSPWLKSVEVDAKDPDVSRWTLAARGIEIAWKARNTQVTRGELIAWKSESGLPNRGKVIFAEDGDGSKSKVTLAIQFDVPSAIARAIDNDFIGRFVEETLLADLKRFRTVALKNRRRELRPKRA